MAKQTFRFVQRFCHCVDDTALPDDAKQNIGPLLDKCRKKVKRLTNAIDYVQQAELLDWFMSGDFLQTQITKNEKSLFYLLIELVTVLQKHQYNHVT